MTTNQHAVTMFAQQFFFLGGVVGWLMFAPKTVGRGRVSHPLFFHEPMVARTEKSTKKLPPREAK
jgi:hypothetical protein